MDVLSEQISYALDSARRAFETERLIQKTKFSEIAVAHETRNPAAAEDFLNNQAVQPVKARLFSDGSGLRDMGIETRLKIAANLERIAEVQLSNKDRLKLIAVIIDDAEALMQNSQAAIKGFPKMSSQLQAAHGVETQAALIGAYVGRLKKELSLIPGLRIPTTAERTP